MNTYSNPILKGFYPDPSICRVDDGYYLVNSSFTYYPGVPIFHSKDLVNWTQIGNVLDRPSQIPLEVGHHSMGIFAPTIRHHEGTFYMITTNVANGGNFVVTATDPAGPWSEPFWLDMGGIDPSLFFDDDGKCWYCGARGRREGSTYDGDNEIVVKELDLETMTLVGPEYAAWHGAAKGAVWAEGPHIYKKDGWYYLLISEGGTDYEHALTIARSKSISEPFEGYICNPILSHRHLGRDYPVQNVGHGDIVETQNGDWWLVCLASRPYGGYFRNLGRETFLAPLIWENGWPVVCPGEGKLPIEGVKPDLPEQVVVETSERDDFDNDVLGYEWLYNRRPNLDHYDLATKPGWITMTLGEELLNTTKNSTFVCKRQQLKSYKASTRMSFDPVEGERAGLTILQSNEYYYTLEITVEGGTSMARVVKCEKGVESFIVRSECKSKSNLYTLEIVAEEQKLAFRIKTDEDNDYLTLANDVDGSILSTDVAGGFVGSMIGLFGIGDNGNTVAFDYLEIK